MRRLIPFVAIASLAICSQTVAQVAGGAGSQGGYQEQSKDYGYDDMKADTARHASPNELAAGADLAKQGKFADAIPHLEQAEKQNPRNATTLIYLGFSHRMLAGSMTGDAQAAEYKTALDCYDRGLAIDSDNKLLHEYRGKLYLLMREYTLASNELKALTDLCEAGCDERTALAQAVAANPPPPTQPVSKQ